MNRRRFTNVILAKARIKSPSDSRFRGNDARVHETVFSRRGSVLLLTLWATTALAAIGIAQATRLSLEVQWAKRVQEEEQAWYLAWTALESAKAVLSLDDPAIDAPKEIWSQAPKESIPFAGGTFRYRILDEQAKIPLNLVGPVILQQLPGFTPEVVEKLMERRSDPEDPKPVVHLGELEQLGVALERIAELESLVTVQAKGAVNIHTASIEVLKMLGLSPQLANQIVSYRAGPDGLPGTPDDSLFTDPQKIPDLLQGEFGPLSPEDQTALEALLTQSAPTLLGISSSFFRVEVEGRFGPHGISKKVVAILERGAGVRGWYEK